MLIEYPDLFHVLIVWRIFRSVFGIHNGFYRELDVVGRKRLTVMPLHIFFQIKSVGTSLFVELPASGEARHHLIVAVVGGKTVKEQNIDLAVFIHGRIDPRVVAAAVNKGFLCCFRFRFCAGRCGSCPADAS